MEFSKLGDNCKEAKISFFQAMLVLEVCENYFSRTLMPTLLIKLTLYNLKGISKNWESFAFVGPSSNGKSPQIYYNWLFPDVIYFFWFCVGSSQIMSFSIFSTASPPLTVK